MEQTQANQTNEGEQQNQQAGEQQNQQAGEQQNGEQQNQQAGEQQNQQQEGAPEAYDFKPPEGQEFDPEFIKTYSEVAKELNLTQDKAQTLIYKIGPVIQSRQQARIEAVQQEWVTTSKTDQEFGGEKLEENLGIAKQALDKFGTSELKELLNTSGIGNHPEVIRFFFRTGKAISPDGFVGGQQEGNASPKTFNDLAHVLYG